ncbi:MAG: hypothetical protein R6U04_05635 [Bacteroidales bacterium]
MQAGRIQGKTLFQPYSLKDTLKENDYAGSLADWNESEVSNIYTQISIMVDNNYAGGVIG